MRTSPQRHLPRIENMYDEPPTGRKELIDHRSPKRLRPGSPLRALGAAVPAIGAVFWLSALLGVGPMVGHELAGLITTVSTFAVWSMTLGRTVTPR
jgi:hypothetical protein